MHLYWEGIWRSETQAINEFIITSICFALMIILLVVNLYQNFFNTNEKLWQTKWCFLMNIIFSFLFVGTMFSDKIAILFSGYTISCTARAIYSSILLAISRGFLYQYLLARLYFTFNESIFKIHLYKALLLSSLSIISLVSSVTWCVFGFLKNHCVHGEMAMLPGVIQDFVWSLILLYIFIFKLTQLVQMYSKTMPQIYDFSHTDKSNNKNFDTNNNDVENSNTNNNSQDNTNKNNANKTIHNSNLNPNYKQVHRLLHVHSKLTILTCFTILTTCVTYGLSTFVRASVTGSIDLTVNCLCLSLSFNVNDKYYRTLCHFCRIHLCYCCCFLYSRCTLLLSFPSSLLSLSLSTPIPPNSPTSTPHSPPVLPQHLFQQYLLNEIMLHSTTSRVNITIPPSPKNEK